LLNAIAQPEQFIEIGEKLAEKKASSRVTVKVSSKRGYIKAKAVVTKRIRTLQVHGQEVDTIGIPSTGVTKVANPQRLYGQHPDAVCRRRQHANARVQGVPG
jgi:anaerobic selenocysteine-containing dehydrogenase